MVSPITMFIYGVIGTGCVLGSLYMSKDLQEMFNDFMKVKSSTDVSINNAGNMSSREKISGIAREYEETLESPLEEKECLAYESQIQNTTGAIKSDIFEQKDSVMFVLNDGDKEILVDPKNAELYLEKNMVGLNRNSVQNIISQETTGQIPATGVSIREGSIEPRESVFLYGDLEYRDDSEFGRAVQSLSDSDFVISNMDSGKVRNTLIQRLFIRTAGIVLLFLAGLSIIGLGFNLF